MSQKAFKQHPTGFFHIDIAEVRAGEGKLYLFVAIDPRFKFAFARLTERTTTGEPSVFFNQLVSVVPYTIRTGLTDNGIQFADLPRNRNGSTARFRGPSVRPRLPPPWHRAAPHKPNHPLTNGQVEPMNRTIKVATVRRYHYFTHATLRRNLAILDADNFARRRKTLRALTPHEAICNVFADEPPAFTRDPVHLTAGLNSPAASIRLGVAEEVCKPHL